MALFTDGQLNGLEDLRRYENAIPNVASIEGIDIAAKVEIAQEEIGNQLLLFLLRNPSRDTRAAIRRTIGLSDVVATAPLQQSHALKTLAVIYRDAYNNQLNDRYLGKWKEYEQLWESAWIDYLQMGVGLVPDPVTKASSPALTTVPGAGTGGTYYVAAAWVNSSGQEGASSDVVVTEAAAGTQLVVTNADAPGNAVGWNVYAGTAANSLALQNGSPIPVESTWMMPAEGITPGAAPSGGQTAERFLVHDRLLQRG